MVWDIVELGTQNKINVFKNGLNIMLSDSWKNAFKWPRKTLKNIVLKSTKNMKLSGFFSNFWGLNYLFYQLFEATFQ